MNYFDPINAEGTKYLRHESPVFNKATLEDREKMLKEGFKGEEVSVDPKTGLVITKPLPAKSA